MKEISRWMRMWGISDSIAVQFLKEKNYILDYNTWKWHHKYADHTPTPKELDAIDFLVENWAHKGLI